MHLPVYTAIPISSDYRAFKGAVAIIMALVSRERDGVGQHSAFRCNRMLVRNAKDAGLRLPTLWRGHFQRTADECAQFGEAAGMVSWHAEGLTDLEHPDTSLTWPTMWSGG